MNSYLIRQYQEGNPFASAVNPLLDEVPARSVWGGGALEADGAGGLGGGAQEVGAGKAGLELSTCS